MRRSLTALLLAALAPVPAPGDDAPLAFERIVIDDDFPGAYQVEVADVDGDGKPDIVALGGSTVAWYQNPTWTKRIITDRDRTPDVITSAARDLDGDGKAEVAIGYDFEMNQPKRGKLGIARQGKTIDDPWTFEPIVDLPSIHRVRWGDLDRDGRPDLVVAPIFGAEAQPPDFQQDPAELVYFPGADREAYGTGWDSRPLCRFPIIHAIEIAQVPGRAGMVVLAAHNEGLSYAIQPPMGQNEAKSLASGERGEPPARGSSEVHMGRFAGGQSFLASLEPWHGSKVVVRSGGDVFRESRETDPTREFVLDDTLDQGHALWVVDVDADGNDEVFAGHRGKGHRVACYRFDGKQWHRKVIDEEIAAQDLRGGDLDGDGMPDVVAAGGSTHNVVWYRPARQDR